MIVFSPLPNGACSQSFAISLALAGVSGTLIGPNPSKFNPGRIAVSIFPPIYHEK